MKNGQEAAEVIALRVLGWLAGNQDLLPVFQGSTGATEADIRAGTGDVAFLVVQCCDQLGLPYEAPMRARQGLPGGEQVNWT